jgi:prepilin-type N-terminal cleavage/methylation domain-containing protein
MIARRADNAGFTLIEVLLAMTLMLVILGATLAVFNAMERGNRDNQRLNESQQHARVATDTLAKRLRNLASPANPGASAISQQPLERATAQDLVFRSVNSQGPATTANPQNLERYRYCLGSDRKLYALRQTWTGAAPTTPADTACPGSGWPEQRVVAENVVNDARPVFHYQLSPQPGTYSETNTVAAADFATAIALRTTLWVDPDVARRPSETSLETRVFLRNQNRPPIAALDVKATSGAKLTLNASSSDDPEGNPLQYEFFDGGNPLIDPATGQPLAPSPSAVFTYKPSAGAHSLTVRVTDVGNLSATSTARTAFCNSTSCTP